MNSYFVQTTEKKKRLLAQVIQSIKSLTKQLSLGHFRIGREHRAKKRLTNCKTQTHRRAKLCVLCLVSSREWVGRRLQNSRSYPHPRKIPRKLCRKYTRTDRRACISKFVSEYYVQPGEERTLIAETVSPGNQEVVGRVLNAGNLRSLGSRAIHSGRISQTGLQIRSREIQHWRVEPSKHD